MSVEPKMRTAKAPDAPLPAHRPQHVLNVPNMGAPIIMQDGDQRAKIHQPRRRAPKPFETIIPILTQRGCTT